MGTEESPSRIGTIRSFVFRHKVAAAITALGAVAVAIFVFVYFEPHKLFINDKVDEAAPTAAASALSEESPPAEGGVSGDPTPVPTQPPAGPKVLTSGDFRSLDHESSGKALIVQSPDGSRVLRFEGFRTSNGPDLVVYLSPVAAAAGPRAYGEGFVNLGELKGNIGDQNYDIPADVDLSKYKSAVVWCRRFAVGFAVAPIA